MIGKNRRHLNPRNTVVKPRISIFEHAVAVLCFQPRYSVLTIIQDIQIWLILSFWNIEHELKQCCFLDKLNIMIVYAHGPKLNIETGMALHAYFYFIGIKKKIATSPVTYAF